MKKGINTMLVGFFLILSTSIYFSLGYLFEFDRSIVDSSRNGQEIVIILLLAPLFMNGILIRLPISKAIYKILWYAFYFTLFCIAFSLYLDDNISRGFNYAWFLVYISFFPLSILGITSFLSKKVDALLQFVFLHLRKSINKKDWNISGNNLVIIRGRMGSGISFHLKEMTEGKERQIFSKLYNNDQDRINELKSLASHTGEELYIVLDCPYVDGLNDIIKELLKNSKINILLGSYYPHSLFDELSPRVKRFVVAGRGLREV